MTRPPHPAEPAPDLDPSTERYARRFQGPAGEWLLSRQTAILLEMFAGETAPLRVLDVGGGHGQIAGPLLGQGHHVTVHASSDTALGQARKVTSETLTMSVGPIGPLPFADNSFDAVTAFRMMAHVGDWQAFADELCRVAARFVVIDFPIPGGVNMLEPLFFGLKRRVEGDTRRFDTMSRKMVAAQFRTQGYQITRSRGQFVLPMVVHRKLNTPAISAMMENTLAVPGLARVIGSPVILRADTARAT